MEPKALLIQILRDFEREYNKLNKADRLLTDANSASWDTCGFFSTKDVERLRARKAVIDNIHKELWDEIKKYSTVRHPETHIPIGQFEKKLHDLTENAPNEPITANTAITEEQATELLSFIHNQCSSLMAITIQNKDPTTKTRFADMKDQEKRMALKEHSFSDKWLFNFLGKIVASTRNLFNKKTSSEKLLESTIEKTTPKP